MSLPKNMKRAAMATVLCLMLVVSGCSTAWVLQAQQIVAELLPAVATILQLIGLFSNGVSPNDLAVLNASAAEVQKDLSAIGALIDSYNKADASAKPGIVGDINNYAQAVQDNLTSLLGALHIKDVKTQQKVQAIVALVITEVSQLAALVPGSPAATAHAVMGVKAKPLSSKDFKKQFNALLAQSSGNPAFDQAAAKLALK